MIGFAGNRSFEGNFDDGVDSEGADESSCFVGICYTDNSIETGVAADSLEESWCLI